MLASLSKNTNPTRTRRLYFFLLLTAVMSMLALAGFPQKTPAGRVTSVKVELLGVQNAALAKGTVVSVIKRELSLDVLQESLARIDQTIGLTSSLLIQEDSADVRNSLMAGALNLEAIGPEIVDSAEENAGAPQGDSTGQTLRFSISLRGDGSADEVRLVQHLASQIKKAVMPNTYNETALMELGDLQSQIRESKSLSEESRAALETSFARYQENQNRLFTNSPSSTGSDPELADSWELKNLTEQRKLAFSEYESNESLDFPDKATVQQSLLRRIEYLDQEIQKLRRRSPDKRLAENDSGVKKASFIDMPGSQRTVNVSRELQELKTDLALILNKMDLARTSQDKSLAASRKLSEYLQERQTEVLVSTPDVRIDRAKGMGGVWLITAVCGLVAGIIVLRIDSRAFARLLTDESSVEQALQIPVVGQVQLPDSESSKRNRIHAMNRWVRRTTRVCELLLLMMFFVFLLVLLANSQFSFYWLNDPIQVLRDSLN